MRDEPRAETVGSLLRTEEIIRAARGDNGPDAGKLLDEAVLDAVKLQEDIGLDVITDGEMRRTAWTQTPRFVVGRIEQPDSVAPCRPRPKPPLLLRRAGFGNLAGVRRSG